MTKMPSYVSTTNACKLCKPLGASIAFKGVEGCVPFLHGSQGCATYMRRYIISHFNEPIDIASSSLGEKHAIYGGGPNLKLGLNNVAAKYNPEVIGLATTCLTETIGDDVKMLLAEYRAEFGEENRASVVSVSTPSYSGTHMEGFHAAVKAVVEQLTETAGPHESVNLLSGFISTADIRYLKDVCEDFQLGATILPDYSETLDGPALNDYPLVPEGGTPVAEIKKMSGARSTIEFGSTLDDDTAGVYLEKEYGVALHRQGLPIGIGATDEFMNLLESLSARELPERYRSARGRLVDAMVDGHKYVFGKRAVVFGEEDLVVGMSRFLSEIGVKPVLCASGGKSTRLAAALETALKESGCEMPEVHEDVDFYQIEERAETLGADLLVGHSKGYSFSRRKEIPLIRVGFPVHDRIGGQRILHLGYHGAQMLFDTVANVMIERKQSRSEVGYSYM